jgi:pimeloyl-ACP methyl ester carboxylesterase
MGAGRDGDGTPVLLVHGTGLNGRAWAPVAGALATAGFRPLALDMRGHGASGRSPDGDYPWSRFAADVLAALAQLGLDRASNLVGVGHSAGASALLLAEAARPGTFARLWTWEPIMSTPGDDLRRARGADLADRARRRRASFASLDEARAHLQGRGMFAEFSPAAFDGFVAGGFVADGAGGVTLACRPEDEARIYEAAAVHDAWGGLDRVGIPVRVVGGQLSPAVPPDVLRQVAGQLPDGEVAVMPAMAHFGPFQGPAPVAADIRAWATPSDRRPRPGSA